MVPWLLLIGDSQLKYVHEYSHLFPAFEITAISKSGMRVEEVDNSMLLATTFFKDVIIHLGTNNLICGDTPEEACQHHQRLIDKVLLLNPGVWLFLSSVLERSPSLFKPYSPDEGRRIKEMNENIQRLNILLKELADSFEGVTFIDNWLKFQSKCFNPYKELLSRDGLHLSPRGVKFLIGNVVNSCSVLHVLEPVASMPTLHPSNFPALHPKTNQHVSDPVVTSTPTLHPTNFPASHTFVCNVNIYPSHPIPLSNRWEVLTDFCDQLPNSFMSKVSFHAKCYDHKIKYINGGSAKGAKTLSIYPRRCEACQKIYTCKSSFYKHKKICGSIKKTSETYPRVCLACNVSYANKCNYSRHKKICNTATKYIFCPCPGCDIKFQSHSDLVNHLVNFHEENLSVENHQFADMMEFNAWKRNLCQKNSISMVRQSGVCCRDKISLQYYVCKFNNKHKHDLIQKKTSRKRKFGCMPNTDCISRMIVKETNSCIHVKYFNTHNHELKFRNVKFYRWDEPTKVKIEALLEQDVPAHTIQESFQPKGVMDEIPKKEHFISTTDINKIRYGLHMKKRLNKDDALSVHMFVQSLERDEHSVLIYKPLGKPTEIGKTDLDNLPHSSQLFCLGIQNIHQFQEMVEGCTRVLCIDAAHGTNQYKYHLLNLVVPDEYGIGYPVAHFVMNYMDEGTLVCLLRSITDKCPKLVVNAVMTDGDEALGNAIRKVFGEDVIHLLCSWHVKRNWQKNLHRKLIGNDTLIGEINEILETLMEERNEQTFHSMLEAFLLNYNVSGSAFIKYFRDNYCNNIKKWAFCYRNFPHARTDTNMFVESFHNKLKTNYLNRKVNRRLDDLIAVLLRMQKINHLALSYKRMMEKPPLGFGGSDCARHMKGMQISDCDVVVNGDGISWNVTTQTNSKLMYTVTCYSEICNLSDTCFIKCCEMSCSNLCCHMYSCSCPDCHSLCKHIHKVHSLRVRSVCEVGASLHPQQSENVFIATSDPCNSKDRRKNYIHSISNLCDKLKTLSENKEVKELQEYINNTLKLLVRKCEGLITSKLSEDKPDFIEPECIPPNSKITSQCRFYQTIKERRPTVHRFQKPNAARKTEIKNSLLSKSNNHSFTLPLAETASITTPLFSVGPFTVSQLHLKSLDYYISKEEVIRLKEVAQDFHRGWLYDTVISAFICKVVHGDDSIEMIDPALSELVFRTNPLQRLFPMFKNDLSGNSKLLIPFNVKNSHWVLSVALLQDKEIHLYDTASSDMKDVHKHALDRWIIVLNSILGSDTCDWKIRIPEHSIQKDGHNCGVFVAWYAEGIAKGQCTTSEFNPYEYRKYMYDVIRGICNT